MTHGSEPPRTVPAQPGAAEPDSSLKLQRDGGGTPAWSRQGQDGFSFPLHKVTEQICCRAPELAPSSGAPGALESTEDLATPRCLPQRTPGTERV